MEIRIKLYQMYGEYKAKALQMLRKHKTISDKLFYNGNQNFQLELQSARIVFEVVKIVGYPCELVHVCLTVVWLICTYMVFHI